MPRYIFPAGTVTNTTGAPLRLTFHATSTTNRRETDLWTVDSSSNLSERIPNGVILTDSASPGAYSAFAGPDDVDTLYVVKNDGASRTTITATGYVTGETSLLLWSSPTASTTLTGTLAAWTITAVDCTAGAGARTLPAASSVTAGTPVCAKKADTSSNNLVVSRAGSDLIYGTGAGATSKTLSLAGEAVEFVSNGVNKWTVRSSDTPSGVLATTYAPILGALQGGAHKYKIVAGTLRNAGAAAYFQPLSDSVHSPTGIDSVTTDANQIIIDYTTLGATKVVSFIATPDETFGALGFQLGATVTLTQAALNITRTGRVADYVSWNGSAFASTNSVFTPVFSGGTLTLTHAVLNGGGSKQLDVSVTSRSGVYIAVAEQATDTTIQVKFFDYTGTQVTTGDSNMKVYVSHGSGGQLDPRNLTSTNFASSNIWVQGIFEVA